MVPLQLSYPSPRPPLLADPNLEEPTPRGASPAEKADAGELAKLLIKDALVPVADELRELNTRLASYLPTESKSAQAIVEHVFGAGGKRIRPALYFMTCRMLGYRGEHFFPIAAVTEFVHTASLLHDDVVDSSSLRRGKPTANSVYGDQSSVLVGDLIYSTASEMMAATGDMEIVKTFARAIRLMSDGELLQLENLFNSAQSESAYFRILECKTGVLIEAACRSAALLAKAGEAQALALSQFGRGVGMAFQLIDDALDYTGAATIVGKTTLSDLPEGKVTLPVIMLREHATAQEQQKISKLLATGQANGDWVQEVAHLVNKYDTAALTVERAHAYTAQAMAALETFPPSAARGMLENLANKLLFRFN